MKRTIALGLLCWIGASTWGCAPAVPVDDRYQSQLRLVDEIIARLEVNAHDERDRQMLGQLRELRKEIDRTRERHLADARHMAEMEEELSRLRVVSTFRVDHLEILFHTRSTPKGITAWIAPCDAQNDAVKVPGDFVISLHRPGVLGMNTLGEKLCEWRLSAEDVKDRWEGPVYRGYHLELPWPEGRPPDVDAAVLQVVFTTVEERTFTVRKEIRIRQEE